MFHISFVLLLLYVPYIQNFLKKCMPAMLLLEKNWGKMAHLPQQQGPVLEISYLLLFFVMTLLS